MAKSKFAVVITTDLYSGSFERELCAHLTGVIGDCEVGSEYVDPEITELFEESVDQVADDSGCYRPVSIELPINYKKYSKKNIVAIFFSKRPTVKQVATMKERLKTFKYGNRKEDNPKFLGMDLVEMTTTIDSTPI
jgi:hypothetical protein